MEFSENDLIGFPLLMEIYSLINLYRQL